MHIAEMVSLKRMPTGRYAFALRQMRERAVDEQLREAIDEIDTAVDKANKTLAIDMRWSKVRNQKSSARGDAALIDNKVDEQIGAIQRRVETELIGDDDDPVVKKAKQFLEIVFPEGVTAIIHQPFEVQLGMMDAMMARVRGDLSDHIEILGLERHFRRLRRLIEQFRAELNTHPIEDLSYDEVRAAREDLHEATCRAIIAVTYHLGSNDEETAAKRSRVLEPLKTQQERVKQARSRQRHPTDVDPETGEEVFTDEALTENDPAPAPASGDNESSEEESEPETEPVEA